MDAKAIRGRSRLMMRLPHHREKLMKLDGDLAVEIFTHYELAASHMERLLAAEIQEDDVVIAEYSRLSLELELEVEGLIKETCGSSAGGTRNISK